MSKYFVTFATTIWRLWELGFSRDFPVREDSPSDASGSLTSNSKTQADSAIHSRRKAAKGEIRVTKRRRIVSRHGSEKNLGSTDKDERE